MYFDRNHIYWNIKQEILPSSLPKKWSRGLPHHEELKVSYLCILWAGIALVSTATRYELDGPGIECQWRASLSALVQTGPGAHQASYTIGTGSFPGVKLPGRGIGHPPPSSAEVKERVELYLYSPTGPLWPVLGRPLPHIYLCMYVNIFLKIEDCEDRSPDMWINLAGDNILVCIFYPESRFGTFL
jgi:hypothetical protein